MPRVKDMEVTGKRSKGEGKVKAIQRKVRRGVHEYQHDEISRKGREWIGKLRGVQAKK